MTTCAQQQATTCPIFQCTPYYLANVSTSQACALNTVGTNNTVQEFVYLQTCNPNNYTCNYDFYKEPPHTFSICKAPQIPAVAPKLPGWMCTNNSQCMSGNCSRDNYCHAGLAGAMCAVDQDCDLFLYCNLLAPGGSVCSSVVYELEECSEEPFAPKCQYGTVCSTGLCRRIQSMPIGELAEGAEGFLACQSLTTYGNKCSNPYKLVSHQVWNVSGSDCLYARANISVAPSYSFNSACGYSSTGMSYCPSGLGDEQALLTYTQQNFFDLKPTCHISELELTACDYAVAFAHVQITTQFQIAQLLFQNYTNIFQGVQTIYLPYTVAIQDNDPCTQNLITYQYWNIVNSSATHIVASALFIVIVTVLALI